MLFNKEKSDQAKTNLSLIEQAQEDKELIKIFSTLNNKPQIIQQQVQTFKVAVSLSPFLAQAI